ncbi:MAG TPA: polysaccharide deacetylase family protein [Candidatus Binatia bacterium]|nr:polysaccharide deacetylase family protein [Candidatus Binatia bacterium]
MSRPNALTIDVEDWFHDESRREGPALPVEIAAVGRRVDRNLTALLELLARRETRATLFVLADVARHHPDLVRRAREAGHEIACHGDRHLPAAERARGELREDVARAKDVLEQVLGAPVAGFRAPCFLRGTGDLWALDVIAECGFRYDSSYLPLRYRPGAVPLLGNGGGPVRLASGLWELPLPLTRLPLGHVVPCAAGGFALRALPYAFTRHFLARFEREIGPAIVYTHPWELDPASPKLRGTPAYVRFFNAVGRGSLAAKLDRLLADFRFAPIAEVFASELGS